MKPLMAGLLLLLAQPGALHAATPVLTPYVAVYSVAWGGTALGEATVTLAPQIDKDCYRYESQTRPLAPVRWFYGSPRETSLFCLQDRSVRARHFEYHNDKREKDNFTLDFDRSGRRVKTLKGGELSQRELEVVGYDRFVIQQAVRLWAMAHAGEADPEPVEMLMVDDDRIATYRFAVTGRETVDTPAGRFDTVKVERVDNPNKTLRSWLAPEREYMPVKIERIEDGKVKLRMLLK